MKKLYSILFLFSSLLIVIIYSGQGCSNVPLEKLEAPLAPFLKPRSELCVIPPAEKGKYTRVLFIVDVSGSNATDVKQESGEVVPASDPTKDRRYNAMNKFFQENKDNTFISWGLEVFSYDNSGLQLIDNNINGVTRNFGDSNEFSKALAKFKGTKDSNGTPYLAAVSSARKALENEVKYLKTLNLEEEPSYHIIFISDGFPTDKSEETIFGEIDLLKVAVGTGQLYLSTVYYNSATQDSPIFIPPKDLLKKMAEHGKGRFQDASQGADINISDLIVSGIFKESYWIKDFYVYNLNASICFDYKIGVDSDADGMCDSDEQSINEQLDFFDGVSGAATAQPNGITEEDAKKAAGRRFDPQSRYSFDTKFNDFIMYRHVFLRSTLPSCTDDGTITDQDHDLLNRCEEEYLRADSAQAITSSWTEVLQILGNKAQDTHFDSDGDGIIDSLEFLFFGGNKSNSVFSPNIVEYFNGRSYRDYFFEHQSPFVPSSSQPYQIKVEFVRKNEFGLVCYNIHQEHLPILSALTVDKSDPYAGDSLKHSANQNVVMIYYTMKLENDPSGPDVTMRYSFQKHSAGNTNQGVSYNDVEFEEVKGFMPESP